LTHKVDHGDLVFACAIGVH